MRPMTDASPDALEQALDAAERTGAEGRSAPASLRRGEAPRALIVRPRALLLARYAVEEWLLIAALAALAVAAPAWLYPPIGLLLAGRYHALGVILHDAVHLPLPGGVKPLSLRLVELLAGYPVATTIDAMRFHHLRHHRDSGMPTDPYFKAAVEHSRAVRFVAWARGLVLTPFWTLRAPFGVVAWLVPSLRRPYARVFLQDRSGDADLGDHPEVARCAREDLGQCLFLAVAIAAALAWPQLFLLGYAIPVVAAGLLASYRLLAEHEYRPCADRTTGTLVATTRDHHTGLVGKLFMAPRNIGFHLVHHLHPQASLGSLPGLYAWYRGAHPELYPPAR